MSSRQLIGAFSATSITWLILSEQETPSHCPNFNVPPLYQPKTQLFSEILPRLVYQIRIETDEQLTIVVCGSTHPAAQLHGCGTARQASKQASKHFQHRVYCTVRSGPAHENGV
jgi:hypothetical protein